MRKSKQAKSSGPQTRETGAAAPGPIDFYQDQPANTIQNATPIRPGVKARLLQYITDEKNPLPADLNVVLQNLYNIEHDLAPIPIEERIPANVFSVLSPEARDWAGLSRRDPALPVLRFPKSLNPELQKTLHTFSTIIPYLKLVHENDLRGRLADVVYDMPEKSGQ